MSTVEHIKSEIERLYETDPNIHISVSRTHPKAIADASPAKIVGVYKHIFQVVECENGKMQTRHTFQYGEVLIGQVKIEELDCAPTVSIWNKK